MPIFMKAYLWAPSRKSSLHWKKSTLRAWPYRPAWSLHTVHQAFGIHYSHCAGSQTSGGSSSPEHSLTSLRTIRNAEIPLPSPLKTNTIAGFISSQEDEISLLVSLFLWSSCISRAMKSHPLWLYTVEFQPSKSFHFSYKKRKVGKRSSLLSSFAYLAKYL